MVRIVSARFILIAHACNNNDVHVTDVTYKTDLKQVSLLTHFNYSLFLSAKPTEQLSINDNTNKEAIYSAAE